MEEDFDANSSRASKESRRRTVSKILSSTTGKRIGDRMDGEDIKAVAAVLKGSNYKDSSHTWTQFLERI